MKYLLLTIILSSNAFAMTADHPSTLVGNIPSVSEFSASEYNGTDYDDYVGRNIQNNNAKISTDGSGNSKLSKSIINKFESTEKSKLESFDTTVGELVQKVEDDRLSKAQDLIDYLNDIVSLLSQSYSIINTLESQLVGYERDLGVEGPFKCENIDYLNPCDNTSSSDKHSAAVCSSDKTIHWTGSKWTCQDILSTVN